MPPVLPPGSCRAPRLTAACCCAMAAVGVVTSGGGSWRPLPATGLTASPAVAEVTRAVAASEEAPDRTAMLLPAVQAVGGCGTGRVTSLAQRRACRQGGGPHVDFACARRPAAIDEVVAVRLVLRAHRAALPSFRPFVVIDIFRLSCRSHCTHCAAYAGATTPTAVTAMASRCGLPIPPQCAIFRLRRTHHCDECGRCVAELDHHWQVASSR